MLPVPRSKQRTLLPDFEFYIERIIEHMLSHICFSVIITFIKFIHAFYKIQQPVVVIYSFLLLCNSIPFYDYTRFTIYSTAEDPEGYCPLGELQILLL